MKKILHIIEAALVYKLIFIFGALPYVTASNIGGFLGRKLGPLLKVNKTARNNIKLAMPELSEAKVEEILLGMWDNLGRVMTEFSHMNRMTANKIDELVTIEGQEHLDALRRENGGFLMTGHFGNWEMIPAASYQKGCPLHIVYRKANNPYVDKIVCNMRKNYQVSASAKGSVGARQIIKALKLGKHALMLVDQKQNDGIAVPLFGRDAMTAPGIATMALKYDCKIFPAKLKRVHGHKFKFTAYPPINIVRSGNEKEDIQNLMTSINIILEGWIRKNPEQWFWVHNRWPKK